MFWYEWDLRCHSIRWWALCQYTPMNFQLWWFTFLWFWMWWSNSHLALPKQVTTVYKWLPQGSDIASIIIKGMWLWLNGDTSTQLSLDRLFCQPHTSGLVTFGQMQERHPKDLDTPFTLILKLLSYAWLSPTSSKTTFKTYLQCMSQSANLTQEESEVDSILNNSYKINK